MSSVAMYTEWHFPYWGRGKGSHSGVVVRAWVLPRMRSGFQSPLGTSIHYILNNKKIRNKLNPYIHRFTLFHIISLFLLICLIFIFIVLFKKVFTDIKGQCFKNRCHLFLWMVTESFMPFLYPFSSFHIIFYFLKLMLF